MARNPTSMSDSSSVWAFTRLLEGKFWLFFSQFGPSVDLTFDSSAFQTWRRWSDVTSRPPSCWVKRPKLWKWTQIFSPVCVCWHVSSEKWLNYQQLIYKMGNNQNEHKNYKNSKMLWRFCNWKLLKCTNVSGSWMRISGNQLDKHTLMILWFLQNQTRDVNLKVSDEHRPCLIQQFQSLFHKIMVC